MRMRRSPRGSFMVRYISRSAGPTTHGGDSSLTPSFTPKSLILAISVADCFIPLLAVVFFQIPQRPVGVVGVEGIPIGKGELPESVCLLRIIQGACSQCGGRRALAGDADHDQGR